MRSWKIAEQSPSEIFNFIVEKTAPTNQTTVVCFDYFDTLAVRCVQPEHTKVLAAYLLGLLTAGRVSGQKIYRLRQRLEKTLCEQNAAAGADLDYNLEDLANRLCDSVWLPTRALLDGFSRKQFVEILLSIELAVERSVQQPCQPMVAVLEAVHRHGLATVLVSDFYLPSRYFLKMLQHHGLEKLLDRVYISADHGVTKGSGKLYDRIIENIGCQPEQMLMIGDNRHADIKMASEAGMQTLYVENARQKDFYRNWRKQTHGRIKDTGFSVQLRRDSCFAEMGITLWLFTYRLFQTLMRDRARHVFFFSKEGELLKRLFDDFQKTLFGTEIIKTHYLIVSRKATFVGSLDPIEKETFERLFNHYRDISLRDFMLSLNMDQAFSEKLCHTLGLDFEKRHHDLVSHPSFARLLQSDDFRQAYEALRQEQRYGFIAYLDSFGIDYANDGLFVVDVGWKGSIQDNIYHILGGRVPLRGFYAGSLIATELRKNNQKTGILFSDQPEPSPFFNVYNNNRSLFEMILGASHGSADGYIRRQELAELTETRKQQVYSRVVNRNDEISVMVLDLPEERRLFEEMIHPLQQIIVETAAACTREFMLGTCRLPDDRWFARKHARMVFRPTGQEIDLFERLYHLENFGIFEYTNFGRDTRATWEQRWANFKGVLLHPELLESGIWPPIILRRMGVGLLRYYDGWRRSVGEFGLRW